MSAGSPICKTRRVRFIGDAGNAHRRGLSAHPALLPLSRGLRAGRAGRATGLLPASPAAPASINCRASACAWSCSSFWSRGTRVPAMARHGGGRAADHGARRRARSRQLLQHGEGRGGAGALRPIRCAGSARSACASPRTPSGCGSGCGSPTRNTSGSQSMARAWWRVAPARRARRARAALSARAGALRRSRAAGLGAVARRCIGRGLVRALRAAAALDRAGVSAQGGRFHQARRAEGPGARRGVARGGRGLDRRGFPGRSGGDRGDSGAATVAAKT